MKKEQLPKNEELSAAEAEFNALLKEFQGGSISDAQFRLRTNKILEGLKAKQPEYGSRDVVEYMVEGLRKDKESGEINEKLFQELTKEILERYYHKGDGEKIQ